MDQAVDIERLSYLRSRYGDEIIDQVFGQGDSKASAPLTPADRELADTLLGWNPPRSECSQPARPKDQRVRPELLLGEELTGLLQRRLGVDRETVRPPLDSAAAGDSVLVAFRELAGRAYAALISASSPRNVQASGWNPVFLRNTAQHQAAEKSAREDQALAPLWTREPLITSFGNTEVWNRIYDPVELFVYGAWRLCLLRGAWTFSDFMAAIDEQLGRLRGVAGGETVSCPVFLGFCGARIDQEVADGDVRARSYRGGLQANLFRDADRLGKPGNGFIVERSLPWAYGMECSRPTHELGAEVRAWSESLAVALAVVDAPKYLRCNNFQHPAATTRAPVLRWCFTGDPICGATSFHFSQEWPGESCPTLSLTPAVIQRAGQLEQVKDPATRIAISRLGRALEQPRKGTDAIVDSVIAWEAMGGDGKGAVVMQVSAVIAHLVSEPKYRRQVRAEIRNLYKVRSSIVHGGLTKPTAVHRNAAVLVGVVALRALLDEHSVLLGHQDRFERLFFEP